MRGDRERLLGVLDAIQRIKRQTAQGRARFEEDEVLQTAVMRWIEIVGEAVRGLSDELRDAHPEIPWRQIIAMRNIVVHVYFEVDTEAVWLAVEQDLPKLEVKVRALLEQET